LAKGWNIFAEECVEEFDCKATGLGNNNHAYWQWAIFLKMEFFSEIREVNIFFYHLKSFHYY
jgi:hypothetical protein